jgi:polyhydroxyalkanoate synthesis regulator phasin
MLKDNPVMKRLVATGEERVGKLVQQLMSNERFVSGVQAMVAKALSAKGTVDKSLKAALAAMNLPSSSDMEQLREKLEVLEAAIAELEAKVEGAGAGQRRER